MLKAGREPKVMEDFLSLNFTVGELANMDKDHFLGIYERTFNPLNQIALNMGFEKWIYK